MRLLVIVHSRSGGTRQLADAVLAGAAEAAAELDADADAGGSVIVIDERPPQDADADAFRSADAVIIATPEHFGAMAGLVKDCFERVYYDIIDDTRGCPYALVVKGRHDGTGTVRGVQALATGLGWKEAVPPLVVIGDADVGHLDAARELGATLAAGTAMGVF